MNRNILSLILAGGILMTACAPKEKPAGGTASATAADTAVSHTRQGHAGGKDKNCPHN